MKIYSLSLFLVLATLVQAGTIQPRIDAIEKMHSEISPSAKKYHQADTIKLSVSGNLITNGECDPEPIWGLLVKNEKEWKTIIDVRALPQALCGLSTVDFKNRTIDICVIDLEKQNQSYYWRFFSKGEYKFTVLSGNRERIIESNSFRIE